MSSTNTSDDEFPKKWAKFLSDPFKDTAESKSNDELQHEVMVAESVISDIENDVEKDALLKVLKEDLKVKSGGYRDAIKSEQAKIKYCLHLLRQRGAR